MCVCVCVGGVRRVQFAQPAPGPGILGTTTTTTTATAPLENKAHEHKSTQKASRSKCAHGYTSAQRTNTQTRCLIIATGFKRNTLPHCLFCVERRDVSRAAPEGVGRGRSALSAGGGALQECARESRWAGARSRVSKPAAFCGNGFVSAAASGPESLN